jgi:hypothetical protein
LKQLLTLLSFLLMAISLAIAYYCQSAFWQAVAINSGTSFMALGVGLLFVNVYLERNSRRGAVRSLLVLSNDALADFHDMLLDLCWAEFGRDQWGKIMEEYIDADGQPQALRQDVRDKLYVLIKSNSMLMSKIERLEETLTELSRMVGWDLDANLLRACLDARISISRLKKTTLDESDEAKNSITEHIIDTDLHCQDARTMLMEIAGISDDD